MILCRQTLRLTLADTAKTGSLTMVHGSNGTFLSSLAALSILSITSHHQGHRSQNTLILHHSRPAARLIPAPPHHHLSNHDHGTRVSVQDLFGNMPVRVKQRAILHGDGRDDAKEWDILKRCIVGLLLAWNSATTIRMRDVAVTKKLHMRGVATVAESVRIGTQGSRKNTSFDLSTIGSILSQAAYVEPTSLDTWVKTSARTLLMTIRGAFSLVPAPNKHVQFISLGIRPLNPENSGKILYNDINRIFSASSFGVLEDVANRDERETDRKSKDRRYKQDGFTNKQLKGGGKGVDRWPMFYIRIELQDTSHLQHRSEESFLDGGSMLSSMIEVLDAMTTGFLKEYHFRPRARRLKKHPTVPEDHRASSSHPGSRPASKRSTPHPNTPRLDMDEEGEPISMHDSRPSPHLVESEAGRNVKRHKPSGRKDLSSSVDTFGSNLKLPSFSQGKSYHLGRGPNGWSRIKSGKRNTGDICGKLEPITQTTRIANPVLKHSVGGEGMALTMDDGSAPKDAAHFPECALCDQDADMGNSLDSSLEDPITAQGGPLIDDVTAAEPPASPERHCEPQIATEETVHWTNPFSKERFLISTRTGLVVPRSFKRHSSVSTNLENPSESGVYQAKMLRKRTKITRSLSAPFVTPKEGSWVGECLRSWENPTFLPAEQSIPQISFKGPSVEASTVLHGRHHHCSRAEIEDAFRESSTSCSAKLSKDSLKNAEVIAQVDKKFILVKMHVDHESVFSDESEPSVLVLIDQHAADERVRVESLLHDLCQPPATFPNSPRSSLGYTSGIATTLLAKPITVHVPAREHNIFKTHAAHFADWGILYELNIPRIGPSLVESSDTVRITISTLPPSIAERCSSDVKQLIQLLRRQVWKREEAGSDGNKRAPRLVRPASQPEKSITSPTLSTVENHEDWLHRISTCPPGILDMLNSRSCRSAIMFNDELGLDDCKLLVRKLAACKFPFQCAHGRPSMVPLVELSSVRSGFGVGTVDGLGGWGEGEPERGFVEAWGSWNGPGGKRVGAGEEGEEQEGDGGGVECMS